MPPQSLKAASLMRKESLTCSMETATVTSKGQVTLPASLRRKLGIQEGSQLLFIEDEVGVRMLREEDIERMYRDIDRARKDLGLTKGDVAEVVNRAKQENWRRHHARRR